MHPIAEAALRAGAKVGEKAVKRVMREGMRAGVDSVLEDVESVAGEVAGRTRGARDKLRGGVGQAREAREEEMPEEETEEESSEADEEEEEDAAEEEEEEEDGDWRTVDELQDAEHFLREAITILDGLAKEKKFSRTQVDRLEKIHDAIVEKLPED